MAYDVIEMAFDGCLVMAFVGKEEYWADLDAMYARTHTFLTPGMDDRLGPYQPDLQYRVIQDGLCSEDCCPSTWARVAIETGMIQWSGFAINRETLQATPQENGVERRFCRDCYTETAGIVMRDMRECGVDVDDLQRALKSIEER
ncbi:MAG: hypothetical protein DRQ54_10960 [Gammaproteobacteria bacterium]|nr:MAG: hypothetical protein DRQ54_10960 [Gammaproteobacteria bacterium]